MEDGRCWFWSGKSATPLFYGEAFYGEAYKCYLKCAGCGHQVMMARPLVEKSIRGLKKAGEKSE